MNPTPLCVDLDGTLIHCDVTKKSIEYFLKRNPLGIFQLFFWFLRGRAFLKKKLTTVTKLDISLLPFNEDVLALIHTAKKQNQSIVLATACDEVIAHEVSNFLGIFDDVIASNGITNQRAYQKAYTLSEKYGRQNFIYIGNSKDDLKVWLYAKQGFAVNIPKSVERKLQNLTTPVQIISRK